MSMEEHIVRILSVEPVTHNVRRFKVEKPANYTFIPGAGNGSIYQRQQVENRKKTVHLYQLE
ncbi:MAG: hypothetical protein WDN26_11175 [Chitinophagaceae bacterium]